MTETNQHGGDLDLIGRKYNIPKKELINFSGNVNPLGIPDSIKEAIIENINCISGYPDTDYISLRKSISSYTNVDIENIIPGNGATELISLFIKTISPKQALIISPSYSEYEREIKLNKGNTILYPLKEDNNFILNVDELISSVPKNTDMIILCNPNNPTGTAMDILQLETLLKHCLNKKIYVMIDETYIEFTDPNKKISAVSLVSSYKNLFIIRGTAKFFSAPGLRLGYGLCSNNKLINKINSQKDPWSVNIFAAIAGEKMFKDIDYITKTKKLISEERKKIISELKKWKNIKAFETESNFVLIKLLNNNTTSDDIFKKLISQKIVIRDASDFPFLGNNYLRFCILLPNQNEMLLNTLKTIIEN